MFKSDLRSASPMLITLRESFDVFLNDNITLESIEKIGFETELGKQISSFLIEFGDNYNVKNLDFQYQKILQIGKDIRYLNISDDENLPDWLEFEFETVFRKIKRILLILEREELN
ncbi:hypothetical protein GKZ90_0006555 [Flavobacterium sp. MC2016-06]|jgi:hypothetical protein|uniref:hypothetical protein n=1 Tax=Flavobacterium sp. MC2016-06 TaxID=2676308 RepID=UPI0012BA65C1|nr:hypothetical protein [Flavobacterium sp. MC2016-06]MBU3857799.1 hypothetical protein [Flavobacterium sp. MC2016-06]